MALIEQYFPELDQKQIEQFNQLPALYKEWNAQVNVVSRKDVDNLEERHVLHSLGIAKVRQFLPGSDILDVGTGGGFPGIPLAIMFPDSQFHLVDSIGKKIKVVNGVTEALGLPNVKAEQIRAEQIKGKYDFVVSRAVTRLSRFFPWIRHNFKSYHRHSSMPNGLLYLKGGELTEELNESKLKKIKSFELPHYFQEEFFETKKVIYIPAQ